MDKHRQGNSITVFHTCYRERTRGMFYNMAA